jgi:Rad3-related DNA helicase
MRLVEPPPVTPMDLGLPAKFAEWRADQWSAVEKIVNTPKRFIVICAATGFGKSITYMAASILGGGRSVVLTATKGLQDQLQSECGSLSSDIRGLANYLCPITESLGIPRDTTVADAPCQCGYGCGLRRAGCGYYDAYKLAQQAEITVTNYACWLYDGAKDSGERGDLQYGIPPVGSSVEDVEKQRVRQRVRMLIADEAHDIEGQLCMFLGVDFSRHECLTMKLDWPDSGLTVDDWREWAGQWLDKVTTRLSGTEQKLKSSGGRSWSKDLKKLRDLKRKLDRLSGMQADDGWIMNEVDVQGKSMAGVRFDPLSPARYAEGALWRGIEKIVLVSATVRPKTAELLGIDRDDLEFVEYDSSFDPKRRPVIHVPTNTRMTYHVEQDDDAMRWWLSKFDALVEDRLDRKGIVHCVSFKRAKFIYDNSRCSRHMMIHNNRDRAQVIEAFKRSDAPRILLSPSVSTGYDFPMEQCEYQIIVKIPFQSVQDKVIKARQEKDKQYGMYLAAQTLVQMTGRGMRSEKDQCETLILDDSFLWFFWRARVYFPAWFQEAVTFADNSPRPPATLRSVAHPNIIESVTSEIEKRY